MARSDPPYCKEPVVFHFFALSAYEPAPAADPASVGGAKAAKPSMPAQDAMMKAVQAWITAHASKYSLLNPDPVFNEGRLVGIWCYGQHPTHEREIRRVTAHSYEIRRKYEQRFATAQQVVGYNAQKEAQREAGVQIAPAGMGGMGGVDLRG